MTTRKSIQRQTLETVQEIRTVVIGVPGTADTGIAGNVKRIGDKVDEHADAIARLCQLHEPENHHMGNAGTSKKRKVGLLGGAGAVVGGAVYAIVQAFKGNG